MRRIPRIGTALRAAIIAMLAAWAVGLGVATVKLQAWQQELSRVLIQLRADDLLRASVKQRDQVHPQWYRQRALALLSAVERLREDTSWSVVMPGSWYLFDDLEERAAERIDSAFSRVVVETIRRELEIRTAAVSGTPGAFNEGPLDSAARCEPAATRQARGSPAAGVENTPAYATFMRDLPQLQALDRAVGAMVRLQQRDTASAEDIRLLVRDALGAELSGSASRSVALFSAGASWSPEQLQRWVQRVEYAVACSVLRSVDAIHAQWLDQDELLSLERQLGTVRMASLLEPGRGAGPLQIVSAQMNRQAQLVGSSAYEWLADGRPPPAPYQHLMRSIDELKLLSDETKTLLRQRAAARLASYRASFQAQIGQRGSGVVWQGATGRLALVPERAALADGLGRLARQAFMNETAQGALAPQATPTLEDMSAVLQARRRFLRSDLAAFPPSLRPVVSRYVDTRVGQHAFELGAAIVSAEFAHGASLVPPVELAQSRINQIESVLLDAGTPALAGRVRERLVREVLLPLAMPSPLMPPVGPAP